MFWGILLISAIILVAAWCFRVKRRGQSNIWRAPRAPQASRQTYTPLFPAVYRDADGHAVVVRPGTPITARENASLVVAQPVEVSFIVHLPDNNRVSIGVRLEVARSYGETFLHAFHVSKGEGKDFFLEARKKVEEVWENNPGVQSYALAALLKGGLGEGLCAAHMKTAINMVVRPLMGYEVVSVQVHKLGVERHDAPTANA